MKPKFADRLLKTKPYKVGKSGNSIGITLNEFTEANIGDRYYQEMFDNGIILLIPKKIWEEKGRKRLII